MELSTMKTIAKIAVPVGIVLAIASLFSVATTTPVSEQVTDVVQAPVKVINQSDNVDKAKANVKHTQDQQTPTHLDAATQNAAINTTDTAQVIDNTKSVVTPQIDKTIDNVKNVTNDAKTAMIEQGSDTQPDAPIGNVTENVTNSDVREDNLQSNPTDAGQMQLASTDSIAASIEQTQAAESAVEKVVNEVKAVDNSVVAEPDAEQLLEFIDGLRGYKNQSFTFDLSNISFKQNKQKNRNKLTVKVLGNTSLVEFTAPARSKGRKILKQAQNMWIRFPGTRNILRVSPAQRLLGETSNGDVTGTNFSEDYSATYEGTQILQGKSVIKLDLTAKHDKATYKRVVFFLDNEGHLPIRSDFYARSGKLAKQAYYTMFKKFNGDLKLHRMKLVDPIIKGSYTWMMFDNYQKETLDAAIFHKDALSR
jgi:hypothetical protein